MENVSSGSPRIVCVVGPTACHKTECAIELAKRIDGEIVSLSQLNQYCQKITDVHGQYAHQSLLDPKNHIKLIDSYEKESIVSTKKRVSELYDDFSEVSKRLAEIHSSAREEMRKKDYMEFELKEIEKASLVPGEEEKIVSVLEKN